MVVGDKIVHSLRRPHPTSEILLSLQKAGVLGTQEKPLNA